MSCEFSISGFLARGSRRLVRIEAANGVATLPLDKFSVSNNKLANDLCTAGLPILRREDLESIVAAVRALSHFEPDRAIDHAGWNRKAFAHQNGKVVGAGDRLVVFQPDVARSRPQGTLKQWKKHVAMPLADHPIAAFAVMAMFAAPLLRFMPAVPNLAFELVGDGGIGKSTVQGLAASVFGPPSSVRSLAGVLGNVNEARAMGFDHPLVIDQVALALLTSTKPKRAAIFAETTHRLASKPGGRVVLLSGRQALNEACGVASNESPVLTLPVTAGGSGGLFPAIPEGLASRAAFVEALTAAGRSYHGTAWPHFVERLVRKVQADPIALQDRLARSQACFLSWAGTDGCDGQQHRVGRAFAAVYAAALRAKAWGALPKGFPCKDIALAALRLHQQAILPAVSVADQLEDMIASGQIIPVTTGANQALQAKAAEQAFGTVTEKGGHRWVKVRPTKIAAVIPDWSSRKRSAEVKDLLKDDGKNLAAYGHLAPGLGRERLFQFRLPAAAIPSLFDGNHGQHGQGQAAED